MSRLPVPQRRAALIEAALRVIARDGVAAASTRAIATEAGMPLASLHYAFRSRDELIGEVIDHVLQEQATGAIGGLPQGADLVDTIRGALHGYLAVIMADPTREQAMHELMLYTLRTPALESTSRGQYESYYDAAAQVLTAIAESTGHVWRRPTPEIARLVITFTDGLALGWLATRDTEAADTVIDLFARGLAALARKAQPATGT